MCVRKIVRLVGDKFQPNCQKSVKICFPWQGWGEHHLMPNPWE